MHRKMLRQRHSRYYLGHRENCIQEINAAFFAYAFALYLHSEIKKSRFEAAFKR